VQLKLDELVRAIKGARNSVLSLEELSEEELDTLKAQYYPLADRARATQEPEEREDEAPPVRRGDS
jgi:low affinity Fe/Cu permease